MGFLGFAEEAEAAAEKAFQTHLIPVFSFQSLQLEEKDFIHSPSVNLQFLGIKNQKVTSAWPDTIMFGAGYAMDYYTAAPGPEEKHRFHGANVMSNVSFGKNNLTAMVSSNSEIPFSSIESVMGAMLYTRQLVKKEKLSFVLGGGVVVGDFGIKIKEMPVYFFALPMFSFNYSNKVFAGTISLLGLPSVQLTLLPESIIRVKGSCGLAGFSSARDITFDCALVCYPLFKTMLKEALSVSVGVMNKSAGTMLLDKTRIKYQYYCAYGEISATLLTFRCGYNFDGKKYVNSQITGDMYKGVFASLQAMYMF